MWEELTLALSGLAAGQETTFTRREEPQEEGAPEDGGHERRFKVRVTEVRERDLPPLDDAFAARLAPDLTLEALRTDVTQRIRSGKEQGRREKRQQALLDQLRERHPLELPQGVVRQEVEQLVHDYAHSLSHRGLDIENSGIDWSGVGQEMQPLGERRVHGRLLLDAIAEAESIAVSEEEFEAALATLARAQKTSTPALRRALDEKGRLGALRSQLRRDKTIRHLLGEDAGTPLELDGQEA